MTAPKQDFIIENVLPVLKPLFDFFEQFGVGSYAVVGVPVILLLALGINKKRIDSFDSIVRIAGIGLIVLLVLTQQLAGTV